ncbi:MAG: radical SAM family heme chaperone HemW [Clostridiales bacterium]|nr:radical SAM family heme chaperone HemW [Clostridiales bacterium]
MSIVTPRGAYIHIPFCVRKCAYCDFLSFPGQLDKRSGYVEALCREIALSSNKNDTLSSIYLGGGTPTVLDAEMISRILSALSDAFTIGPDCEITIEGNPGTLDEPSLSALKKIGVNRLSLGIQSLSDLVLQTLGRIHDAETGKKAIEAAQEAGFRNLSCDIMLGIPGQTMEDVKETLDFFLLRKIPHISLYSLILEEGTPMYERYGGDVEKYVSQEQDREMYHYVVDTLASKGYEHYEISNMALPGYESRHNTLYWRAENYYGFGVGAHYYLGNERGRHTESLKEYMDILGVAGDSWSGDISLEDFHIPEEVLTKEDRMKEFMMLGFRMGCGVNDKDFEERFGVTMDSAFADVLKKEREAGLILYEKGFWRLTEKGFDLANQVFQDYI